MKATTAFLCGLAATLLLAIGFARTAERFDPIMHLVQGGSNEMLTAAACAPCAPCADVDTTSRHA